MNFKNIFMRMVAGTLELIKVLTNIKTLYEIKNSNCLKYIFQILAK